MLRLVPLALAALFLAAPAQSAVHADSRGKAHRSAHVHRLVLELTIDQRGTTRDPHPPAGDAGDVFTTTILLANTTAALGKPAKASVGGMSFQYVLHGKCSTESCAGATADIVAVSRLPGGTITAGEKGIQLGHPPIVLPITKGTGTFKGATGSIVVGAEARPINTYKITLP